MRYYGFKLGTNVEEIKENAKIELQHYGYNNTLESINSYMYQNMKNDRTFLVYREEDNLICAIFSYNEQKLSFRNAYEGILEMLQDIFGIKQVKVKSLGLALAGDEMKFLIPISIESFEQIVNSLKIQTNIEGTNEIYNQLNKVLYLLEISCYFNYIPSTKEDGEGYFNKLMMEIRQDVDKTFVNKPIIRKRLYELVDEVDFIINSCEVPGVPDNWLKLNPNIKYFDSVFDIIEENPELYKSIKNEHLRGNPIQFNFFPSKQEIAERQKYFEEKRQKYPTRTIDRFYQDELVETLNKRFNQCLEKIANI